MSDRPYWLDLGDTAVIPLVETPRLLIEPAEFFADLDADTDRSDAQLLRGGADPVRTN